MKNFLLIFLVSLFGLIPCKLMYYRYYYSGPCVIKENQKRLDILDSEKNVIATSVRTFSIYFSPYECVDSYEEIAQSLSKILEINQEIIMSKLLLKSKFVWIKRHISPEMVKQISLLGYSGVHIIKDVIRFYPYGDLFYHIIGKVDEDNKGLIGVENAYDAYLTNPKNPPLITSLRLSLQSILKSELVKSLKSFHAKNVGGILICAQTGKILAMFSKAKKQKLNPHMRSFSNEFNFLVQGKYELGSVLKVLSAAMLLDYRIVQESSQLHIPAVYKVGQFTVKDYGYKHDNAIDLTFKEAFVKSSNIAFLMLTNGNLSFQKQVSFYDKLGLFESFNIDNLFVRGTCLSNHLRGCDISVFSYGYGISVSIIGFLRSFLRVVTGKQLNLHIEEGGGHAGDQNLFPSSIVRTIRAFLQESASHSSSLYDLPDSFLGGKTGTSKKILSKSYQSNSNFTTYVFAFPINDPQVVGIVCIDDPKKNGISMYASTSAMITSINIIKKLINWFKINNLNSIKKLSE